MHPITSPSDFIYRRPFGSAPAVVEKNFSNSDEPQDDEAKYNPDYLRASGLSHEAIAAFDCRYLPPMSGPATLASEASTELHLEDPFLKESDSPSPSPCLFQPIGRSLHGQPFFSAQKSTECTEPVVWQSPPDSNQACQESAGNQDGDKRVSNASESTMYQTPSARSWKSEQVDRICDAVGAAYDICLQATKTYLSSHHANLRARASQPDNLGGTSNHGESRTASAGGNEASHGPALNSDILKFVSPSLSPSNNHYGNYQIQPFGPVPPTSSSLLKNISGICNMLWAGSQRDRLTVLNVERIAVDNMARLLSWAETVALGDDEWALCDEDALRRVLDAGKSLCVWMGVLEAVREMEGLEGQLMRSGGGVWEV